MRPEICLSRGTFETSYEKLMTSITELFFNNYEAIQNGDLKACEQMGEGTREIVDGRGAMRIAEVIQSL